MNFYNSFILFAFFCDNFPSFLSLESRNKETLRLVQILTRHGEKNPEGSYPTDPFKNATYWPGGYGQLTDKGKLRSYNTGQYLREQYGDFIDEAYNPKDVYMQSSDYERTIRSAMTLLAGLYKESNLNSTWNPDIKWEPIPVHTIARENDRFFQGTENCPKREEIFNFVFNESDYAKRVFSEENKDALKYISDSAGIDFSKDLHKLGGVYNILNIQKEQGLELPTWTDSLLNSAQLGNVPYMVYVQTFNLRLDWLRLWLGPFLSTLTANMEEVASPSTSEESPIPMRLWLTHDNSLSALISALNLYEQKNLPVYGSSIILELHEVNNQENSSSSSSVDYFVEVYIRNDTTSNAPVLMSIPECPSPCSLETFSKCVQKFIPEDWEKECLEPMSAPLKSSYYTRSSNKSGSSSSTVAVISLLILCSIICTVYWYSRRRNIKKSMYEEM